jgi:hypothetical protein
VLFDDDFLEDPYPRYTRWRETAPVWWDESNCAWVLSRYDDVRSVFKDSETYSSSAMGEGPGNTMALPLLTDDPPRHTKLRALVSRAFTSRALKEMESSISALAGTVVGRLDPAAPVDIAAELTIPLPISVIADLMGIPAERAPEFKRWSDAVTMTREMSDEHRMAEIAALVEFFQGLIPERRQAAGGDLVSRLVTAEVDGDVLTDEDIVGFCILLLIAGNETTTNLLSNLLNHLAGQPQDWARLRADRSLVDTAIEEILRYDAPVQYVDRKLTRDVEFYGQPISAGERVTLLMGSANRDERVYPQADSFRLDRDRAKHLSFGHGIHFCLGAPLGRMEARYTINALLDRFAAVSQSERSNERTHSHMLRGFHHLWLEFQPA